MKTKQPQDQCNVIVAPWETAKTKREAYEQGRITGYHNGNMHGQLEASEKIAKLKSVVEARQSIEQVLKSLAVVADAAAHAVTAYINKL